MRKVKKAKWLVVLMVVAMLFAMVPAVGAGENNNNVGQEKIIYGVVGDGSSGSLWMIDPTADPIVEEEIVDISDVNGATNFYPNGLAFDEDNNRLYYAIRKNDGTSLYFYDLDEEDFELAAEDLPGNEIYGATWGGGKYWYIPNGSSDMYSVSFDADGVNGLATLVEGNFTGANKSFNFGDIALDAEENVIYVSTSFSGTHKEFFKYDLNEDPGARYSMIVDDTKAVGLQLGFGTGGVLYGHNTFGEFPAGTKGGDVDPMEWFEVNKDGTTISLGVGVNEYNDLSSGPVEEPPTYGFCGYKYDAATGEGLEGWEIKLYDEDGNYLESDWTDEDGKYCFYDLPEGTYRVSEVEQDGYTQVYPDGYHEVTLPDDVTVYGVETATGDLYEINVLTGDKALIFDGTQDDSNQYFPNALAFDNENQRLYYAIANGELYFHELGSGVETYSGDLETQVAGATFNGGYYWYIPNGTDDLYKVSFDDDGLQDAIIPVKSNISGALNLSFNFGDIVAKDGIIYGSTTGSLDTVYFTYDIAGESFNVVSETDALNLQLAFAVDGLLYGHSTGSQAWYSIEMASGVTTALDWSEGARSFTDLASGKSYDFRNEEDRDPVCQTAWAYGPGIATPNKDVDDNPSNAWGWTNEIGTVTDAVYLELWAAAGQNDFEKGYLVGQVIVEMDGDKLKVTYQIDCKLDCWISEAHLWVGDEELPRVGRWQNPSAAPGAFNYKEPVISADGKTATFYDVEPGEWLAAHAVVCCYDLFEENGIE